MPDPLLTLTTDFGEGSPYVAALKGAALSVHPQIRIIDLSHRIPPQDLLQAAFFLATTIPYFPPHVLHLVVVDPGVGTDRAILYVEVAGHRLLVPDNGCWTILARSAGEAPRVLRLNQPRFWRQPVSPTFHGRDIFGPAAGYLCRGVKPEELGEPVSTWVELALPQPRATRAAVEGQVVVVDDFGNLITNLTGDSVATSGAELSCKIGGRRSQRLPRVRTYGEARPGTLVALISSSGWLELAVSHGNAARRLRARVGTPVIIKRGGLPPGARNERDGP
jgi:S-adenosylmethionine hydrolase